MRVTNIILHTYFKVKVNKKQKTTHKVDHGIKLIASLYVT